MTTAAVILPVHPSQREEVWKLPDEQETTQHPGTTGLSKTKWLEKNRNKAEFFKSSQEGLLMMWFFSRNVTTSLTIHAQSR